MNKKISIILVIFFLMSGSITVSSAKMIQTNESMLMNYFNIPNDHYEQLIINQEPTSLHTNENTVAFSNNILQLIEQIDTALMIQFIEELTSFGPRLTTTQACKDAGKYIYNEMKDLGLEVSYHNWTSSASFYGSNIEGVLPGVDPSNEDILIVCGHYDTVQNSPGADDNGAGTAAVLAAATILSQYSFNYTIRFVTFDGEEQGLFGSRYYAERVYENEEPVISVFNLDMMGYAPDVDSESKVILFDNEPSSWITDLTIDVSQTYVDAINLEVVHGGYSGRSDHASFHAAGVDAIFYFEYEFNPNYHSSQDILENMNPSYAANVTKLMLGTVVELAELVPQQGPNVPAKPTGRANGKINVEYDYKTSVIDPNADKIYLMWNWGDGTTSDWLGPYDSGSQITTAHTWNTEGDFEIMVKAKDIYEQESEWSDPLSVSMPKSKLSLLSDLFIQLKYFKIFEHLLDQIIL